MDRLTSVFAAHFYAKHRNPKTNLIYMANFVHFFLEHPYCYAQDQYGGVKAVSLCSW